ncbi:unnamed protein product, partial [Effrenium voratum]
MLGCPRALAFTDLQRRSCTGLLPHPRRGGWEDAAAGLAGAAQRRTAGVPWGQTRPGEPPPATAPGGAGAPNLPQPAESAKVPRAEGALCWPCGRSCVRSNGRRPLVSEALHDGPQRGRHMLQRCYEYAGALGQTAEEPAIEIRRP